MFAGGHIAYSFDHDHNFSLRSNTPKPEILALRNGTARKVFSWVKKNW